LKSGGFEAVGWETGRFGVGFVLLLAGTLQFFPVLALSQLGGLFSQAYDLLFFPSLFVMVACLVLVASVSRRFTKPGFVRPYQVSYEDRRDDGGELELTYANAQRHEKVAVESVTVQKGGLWRPAWSGSRPVTGKTTALRIRFKHRGGVLYLGFESQEEMAQAYEFLR